MVVRPIQVHGRRRFMVDGRIAGKRVREVFESRAAAEVRKAELLANLQQAGELWQELSTSERRVLADLHRAAAEAGTTLSAVWHEWQADRRQRDAEAIRSTRNVRDVVGEFLVAKEKAKVAPNTLAKLRMILRWLVAAHGQHPVGAITDREVRSLLESRPARSWNTLAIVLSGFFAWTVKHGLRPDNPVDRIERRREVLSAPRIFRLAELDACLDWLRRKRPESMGWFVLTTFCGLRPEEAMHTAWTAVRLGEWLVIVDERTTKTRTRRVVYPPPRALALLAEAKAAKSLLPTGKTFVRRTQRMLAKHLGWEGWPKDITRHTAASYWLAATQDSARVAEQLGHSVAVLKRRYQALATRETAEQWFNVRPTGKESLPVA